MLKFLGEEYYESTLWPMSLVLLISGGLVFAWGRMLNGSYGLAELMDADDTHTLMLLPLEYIGILLGVCSPLYLFGVLQWLLRLLGLH